MSGCRRLHFNAKQGKSLTLGDVHGSVEHVSQALDSAHVLHLAHQLLKPAVRYAGGCIHTRDVSGTRRSHCGVEYKESLTSGDDPGFNYHVS